MSKSAASSKPTHLTTPGCAHRTAKSAASTSTPGAAAGGGAAASAGAGASAIGVVPASSEPPLPPPQALKKRTAEATSVNAEKCLRTRFISTLPMKNQCGKFLLQMPSMNEAFFYSIEATSSMNNAFDEALP
jgi:hypothetical protein